MGITNFVLYALTMATAFVALFAARPWAARARVGAEAKRIEYSIMHAVLDGDIEPDDPALDDLIAYARLLSEHAEHVGLVEATAMMDAARSSGESLDNLVEPQATYAHMTPKGRKVAMQADRDLQKLFRWYLINGSRVWFVLIVVVGLARLADRFSRSRHRDPVARPFMTPHRAAFGYRAAVRVREVRPALV